MGAISITWCLGPLGKQTFRPKNVQLIISFSHRLDSWRRRWREGERDNQLDDKTITDIGETPLVVFFVWQCITFCPSFC